MLSNKKLFLFDIDGTVCQGERLIDGTMQFLEDSRVRTLLFPKRSISP